MELKLKPRQSQALKTPYFELLSDMPLKSMQYGTVFDLGCYPYSLMN